MSTLKIFLTIRLLLGNQLNQDPLKRPNQLSGDLNLYKKEVELNLMELRVQKHNTKALTISIMIVMQLMYQFILLDQAL